MWESVYQMRCITYSLRSRLEDTFSDLKKRGFSEDINTLDEFKGISPSSEMLSKFIYTKLKEKISCVSKVAVWETERACACYLEE